MVPHRKDGRPLQATDFHWVLTVPAIWKDRGKQMMKEAAYKVFMHHSVCILLFTCNIINIGWITS